jgi:hypothetical protein
MKDLRDDWMMQVVACAAKLASQSRKPFPFNAIIQII